MSATADSMPKFVTPIPQTYAQVTVASLTNSHPLIDAMVAAFQDAMAMRGKLSEEAYRVHGFSGRKFRLFINNLMYELEDPRYLEIGLFHGASFCSAIARNKLRALGVDNWTEYGGTPDLFMKNLASFRTNRSEIDIKQADFRTLDFETLGPFNVLFYDGSHAEKDQYDGVIMPKPGMDDRYILIVDDWNWGNVRSGTMNALRDGKMRIDYQIEVRTTFDDQGPPLWHGSASEWHNGCLIAAITKL